MRILAIGDIHIKSDNVKIINLLKKEIQNSKFKDKSLVIVVGGDGFMLETLKKNKNLKKIDKTQSSEIKVSEKFFEEFDKIDINNMSPLDSLNILNKLKLLRNSND